MYKTISFYDFAEWFESSETYKNNFSRVGLRALFDYLEELDGDFGDAREFDPVAFCGEYTEVTSLDDFNANRGTEYKSREEVEGYTTVISIGNSEAYRILDESGDIIKKGIESWEEVEAYAKEHGLTDWSFEEYDNGAFIYADF